MVEDGEQKRPDIGLDQRIIEAIQAGSLEGLKSAIIKANKVLTRKELGYVDGCEKGSLHYELEQFLREAKERKFATSVIYLGDSRLSQIVMNVLGVNVMGDEVLVGITGNSTNEVKRKWEELRQPDS